MKTSLFLLIVLLSFALAQAQTSFEKDIIETSNGDLEITFIGHGTLYFEFESYVIHVDPVGRYADYSTLPKADLILITHHHGDHLDSAVIETLWKHDTEMVLTQICFDKMQKGIVMNNGDEQAVQGFPISAVPAYNVVHKRDNGDPFHPKGVGNGYIIGFGDKSVYIGGDTEDFPEMAEIGEVDIAFLPMNLPYTMTPEMVANAVEMFHPKILYPYHFGNTDVNELVELLKDKDDIEVRIRKMK
jgi:L-ascorbate metabolism protein UlaG (beta-lactamase superfamily)